MKLTKYLLFLCVICFFSCNENYDEFGGPPELNLDQTNENSEAFIENFGNSITRNFLGKVVDINNNPIADATITIGASIASTDTNGVFVINEASVRERFAYIKVDKAGYIHGSRAVVPSSGTNKVTIMLLEATVVGTTTSGTAETISMIDGSSVALDGNYISEDGSTYEGNVNVIMHHLDPTDEAMENQMPGMLFAANSENEERMLQTLGMLAVELRDDNNNELNLAENSTAEITIPVDASLLSNAPSTIPLWYFDEFYGYWKEQGEATLVGNQYVGTVSHFSFWNCDIPAEAVSLCVIVTDENDNALANLRVNITSETYGTRGGNTNENGEVCGLIPGNETLTIDILDLDVCGNNPIYTASIGPYSTDATEAIIISSSPDIISETITGTFNNCDGNSITNGYVVLTYGSQQFYDTVVDGTFQINMIRCSADNMFSIEALDIDNLQSSGEINFTFSTPLTNLGNFQSCNTITEFITYEIDGNSFLITDNIEAWYDENSNWELGIITDFNAQDDCMWLIGNINASPFIGTYDILEPNNNSDTGFNFTENCPISFVNPSTDSIIFNLTAFGDVGEYIDINFNGTYEGTSGSHTINGTIHVLRDQ